MKLKDMIKIIEKHKEMKDAAKELGMTPSGIYDRLLRNGLKVEKRTMKVVKR